LIPTTRKYDGRPVDGGLKLRTVLATAVLAILVAGAFAVLLVAVEDLRASARMEALSETQLDGADRLNLSLIQMELGLRGTMISRGKNRKVIQQFLAARTAFPVQMALLERLEVNRPQAARLETIRRDVSRWSDHALQGLRAIEAGRAPPVRPNGSIQTINAQFDAYRSAQLALRNHLARRDEALTSRAVISAIAGLASSLLLVLLFYGYLSRVLISPVRRVARAASRLAGGDLAFRVAETGSGEALVLERSFNTMAASLERRRDELSSLADEQSALRRVATLVASGVSPGELFDAVARETLAVMDAASAQVWRYEADVTATVLADCSRVGDPVPLGTRVPLDGESVTVSVWNTQSASRSDDLGQAIGTIATLARERGLRAAVAAPIVVNGRLWGVVAAGWQRDQLPPAETEGRMAKFAELLATTIANAESSEALRRLADEQTALRRVATLVAGGAPPTAVFDAVVAEMELLLGAGAVALIRYEPADAVTFLAYRGPGGQLIPPGAKASHVDGESATAIVRRTKRPARHLHADGAPGALAAIALEMGFRSSVGAPLVVDGNLWGCIVASWGGGAPPIGTEERMAGFAQLLETAIANADSRDQLTASRARMVTEAHEARRRVVQDLHDGAQQGLVHTIIALKLARRALDEGMEDLAPRVSEALGHAETANRGLRELVHGILPSTLTREGLWAGVDELAERMSIPVEVEVGEQRFAPVVEATAYFVVTEALTNVVKHARAERAKVRAFVKDEALHVQVCDNGVGGADPRGHGLLGLSDRVTALEGRLSVETPAGGGTILTATLPLNSQ
jgi:signal transduction histidine kinase